MGNTRALAATIVALTVVVFGRPSPALAQDAELVIEWNRVLFSVVPPGSPAVIRPAAMLHIAMFDAVNAIERRLHAISRSKCALRTVRRRRQRPRKQHTMC